MIDVNLVTRKPWDRIVKMYIDVERTHLEESIDHEGMIEWTDDELFQYVVSNDIDHIWIDLYMMQELIADDDYEE